MCFSRYRKGIPNSETGISNSETGIIREAERLSVPRYPSYLRENREDSAQRVSHPKVYPRWCICLPKVNPKVVYMPP